MGLSLGDCREMPGTGTGVVFSLVDVGFGTTQEKVFFPQLKQSFVNRETTPAFNTARTVSSSLLPGCCDCRPWWGGWGAAPAPSEPAPLGQNQEHPAPRSSRSSPDPAVKGFGAATSAPLSAQPWAAHWRGAHHALSSTAGRSCGSPCAAAITDLPRNYRCAGRRQLGCVAVGLRVPDQTRALEGTR